jgi:hypothetical protein
MFYDDVASNGAKWAAVGSDGKVRLSTDAGATWTTGQTISSTWLRGVASDGVGFVVAGHLGVIYTSPQGTTWTQRSSSATGILHSVACNGSQYVAVGEGGKIIYSDGAWQGAALTSYAQWAVSRGMTGGVAAYNADWDGDGTSNGQEFIGGTRPTDPSDRWSPLPEIYSESGVRKVRLAYQRSLQASTSQLAAEMSTDGLNWFPMTMTARPDGTGFTERREWVAPLSSSGPRAFFRFRYPLAP